MPWGRPLPELFCRVEEPYLGSEAAAEELAITPPFPERQRPPDVSN